MDEAITKIMRASIALRLACEPGGGAFVKYVSEPPKDSLADLRIITIKEDAQADSAIKVSDGSDWAARATCAEAAANYIKAQRKRGFRLPRYCLLDEVSTGCFIITPTRDALASAEQDERSAQGYREIHETPSMNKGRLDGKIAIVTGAAQGFGLGIANAMAREGARIVVADMNLDGAREQAERICSTYGKDCAVAAYVNVTDEESVEAMAATAALNFGGLDILVSNAGVLFAGGIDEMTKKNFELVTSVNYTGYFLCVKYAGAIMKYQRSLAPTHTADIIEINSKSGLEGSNRNCAYAGSKFGGIGLTQSFALELVEHGVKVNAICPGNLLDGPLWSDPVRGLFRQYLDAGKVPGAKTIADVRAHYESRVPMGRGCQIEDVARAIFYVVEQQYETGQAVPVTGGQVMLN